MDDFPELTIGEVAKRAGIATSKIRYYERVGLLPAPQRITGQRRYDAEVLGRLAFIGVAQSAGFKLREIRALLAGIDEADGMAGTMRALSERKLAEVEALIERTQAMKDWLEVAKECGCATPEECALFPEGESEPWDPSRPLPVVRVSGRDCRRRGGPSAREQAQFGGEAV